MYDLDGFLVFGFCGNEFVVALKRLLMFYIGFLVAVPFIISKFSDPANCTLNIHIYWMILQSASV